jgi:epoxyqueuosine reductase
MTHHISRDQLSECAAAAGLVLVGVGALHVPTMAVQRLRQWQEHGCAAGMRYMQRPAEWFGDAKRLLPEARSLVVCAASYCGSENPVWQRGTGRVARYAWGKDYHEILRGRLQSLVDTVAARFGRPVLSRIVVDAAPLLERAIAAQAGIGWIGRNSMLIAHGQGSYMFLGEVLWDVALPESVGQEAALAGHCGGCSKCVESCPTGALTADGLVDARLCRSYLTIEKRGALSEKERESLGEWVFGCDVCQEVCPHNNPKLSTIAGTAEFGAQHGCGSSLRLEEVLTIRTDAEYARRFSGTPLMRCRREGLLRNAAVVAGNTGAVETLPELAEAASNDSSAVVRQHALWGMCKILAAHGAKGGDEWRRNLERALADPEEEVRAEARRILKAI